VLCYLSRMDPTRRQSGQDQREPAHRQTRVWRWTAPGGWRNCAPQTDHLTSQPGGRSCQTEAAVHSDKRQPSVQPTLRFSFEPALPRTLLKVRWIPAFTPPASLAKTKRPRTALGAFSCGVGVHPPYAAEAFLFRPLRSATLFSLVLAPFPR
jgi:hypothetical protein